MLKPLLWERCCMKWKRRKWLTAPSMATNAAVLQPVVMGLLQLTARASGHCWLATVVHRISLLNLTIKSHCASCRCRFLWRQTEAHSGLFPVVPTIFDKWFEVLFIGQCLYWEGVGLNWMTWNVKHVLQRDQKGIKRSSFHSLPGFGCFSNASLCLAHRLLEGSQRISAATWTLVKQYHYCPWVI